MKKNLTKLLLVLMSVSDTFLPTDRLFSLGVSSHIGQKDGVLEAFQQSGSLNVSDQISENSENVSPNISLRTRIKSRILSSWSPSLAVIWGSFFVAPAFIVMAMTFFPMNSLGMSVFLIWGFLALSVFLIMAITNAYQSTKQARKKNSRLFEELPSTKQASKKKSGLFEALPFLGVLFVTSLTSGFLAMYYWLFPQLLVIPYFIMFLIAVSIALSVIIAFLFVLKWIKKGSSQGYSIEGGEIVLSSKEYFAEFRNTIMTSVSVVLSVSFFVIASFAFPFASSGSILFFALGSLSLFSLFAFLSLSIRKNIFKRFRHSERWTLLFMGSLTAILGGMSFVLSFLGISFFFYGAVALLVSAGLFFIALFFHFLSQEEDLFEAMFQKIGRIFDKNSSEAASLMETSSAPVSQIEKSLRLVFLAFGFSVLGGGFVLLGNLFVMEFIFLLIGYSLLAISLLSFFSFLGISFVKTIKRMGRRNFVDFASKIFSKQALIAFGVLTIFISSIFLNIMLESDLFLLIPLFFFVVSLFYLIYRVYKRRKRMKFRISQETDPDQMQRSIFYQKLSITGFVLFVMVLWFMVFTFLFGPETSLVFSLPNLISLVLPIQIFIFIFATVSLLFFIFSIINSIKRYRKTLSIKDTGMTEELSSEMKASSKKLFSKLNFFVMVNLFFLGLLFTAFAVFSSSLFGFELINSFFISYISYIFIFCLILAFLNVSSKKREASRFEIVQNNPLFTGYFSEQEYVQMPWTVYRDLLKIDMALTEQLKNYGELSQNMTSFDDISQKVLGLNFVILISSDEEIFKVLKNLAKTFSEMPQELFPNRVASFMALFEVLKIFEQDGAVSDEESFFFKDFLSQHAQLNTRNAREWKSFIENFSREEISEEGNPENFIDKVSEAMGTIRSVAKAA